MLRSEDLSLHSKCAYMSFHPRAEDGSKIHTTQTIHNSKNAISQHFPLCYTLPNALRWESCNIMLPLQRNKLAALSTSSAAAAGLDSSDSFLKASHIYYYIHIQFVYNNEQQKFKVFQFYKFLTGKKI